MLAPAAGRDNFNAGRGKKGVPDFVLELESGLDQGKIVVGLDEAGRGPLAGPVVAAAVWLRPGALPPDMEGRLNDSKKVLPGLRQELFCAIAETGAVGLGLASVDEIDRLNVLHASLLAMTRAAEALAREHRITPEIALVDGNKAPTLSCECRAVIGGDGLSNSIAAASIVAKVERDRLMDGLAHDYPGYGWERNRGYGTAEHRQAMTNLGLTMHHRRSFAPVRECLSISV